MCHYLFALYCCNTTRAGLEYAREEILAATDSLGRVSLWLGWQPVLLLLRAKDARVVLQNASHRKKNPLGWR